jgi:cullin-associated NEDD8-dissociated protein 1
MSHRRSHHSSSTSSSSVSIQSLLEKTEHYDKDERYMATSDLCELLKRPGNSGSGGVSNSHSQSMGSSGNSGSSNSNSNKIFDPSTERRICTAVLRLLHDKSNDVQAVAVKTLGVLLTTVPQELVLEIADSLADQVLDASKSELRDVYAIGLRTLVKTIPSQMGDRTSERLIGRLLDGIRASSSSSTSSSAVEEVDETVKKTREEIVLCCLDILTDLLGRFGATSVTVTRQHDPVLQICLNLLTSRDTSAVVRKRAGNALGCLSVVLSDALLVSAVERLLGQIDESEGGSSMSSIHKSENTRALIRTMCTVSSAVGNRLQQPQIDRIVPIFLKFTNPEKALTGDDVDDDCGDDDDAAMDDNDDNTSQNSSANDAAVAMANELRESCFMGFESFVQKCPNQVEPHIDKIVQAAIAYMSYDPNYSYGIDEDGDEMDEGNGDGDDGNDDDNYGYDDDDDEYGEEEDDFYDDDDDDESWKVRRSAIRALTAIVEANRHDPGFLWSRPYTVRRNKSVDCVASALVARFKEREENCRVGVLETFAKLLEVTTKKAATSPEPQDGATSGSSGKPHGGANILQFSSASAEDDEMNDSKDYVVVVDLRNKYAPALVKACEKILGVGKNNKGIGERSKTHALGLLSTLCKAPGGVGGQAEILSVFKHIQTLLGKDSDSDEGHSSGSTSKALRLDALSLVVAVLESGNHDPACVRKALTSALLPQLCASVKEQWYKVIAEGLRALAAVPRFFVVSKDPSDKEETVAVANKLYESVEPLLAAHDVDQEIKECALMATAKLLSELAGGRSDATQQYLTKDQTDRLTSLLLERLKNETTRIPAIKTLSTVSSSNPDLGFREGILKDMIKTMAGFLKMSSRSLRQTSLEALDVVVTHHGHTIVGETSLYSSLLSELSDLVVDSDLHISHLALYVKKMFSWRNVR